MINLSEQKVSMILLISNTVWSPVTDHYVNKVKKNSVNSKYHDCFMLQIKVLSPLIINANDF